MLNKDYTAKLLDLEDVIVTNVETISGELRVYLELPRTKHACPACGTLTACVHDYRMQTVKDHQSDKDHQNQHKAALQDADEIFAIYFYISFYHNDLDHGTTMIFFIANQS